MTPTPSGTELAEPQRWYNAQCDGDWEHGHGVRIATLDNPGWSLEINLSGTDLEHREFRPIGDLEPTDDWWSCRVKDGKFAAHGGPAMLGVLLRVFLTWAATAAAA